MENNTATQPGEAGTPAIRFLRLSEVTWRVGLSAASIYRMIKRKDFPAPVQLGLAAVGWKSNEIEEWITKRANGPRVVDTTAQTKARAHGRQRNIQQAQAVA